MASSLDGSSAEANTEAKSLRKKSRQSEKHSSSKLRIPGSAQHHAITILEALLAANEDAWTAITTKAT